MTNGYENFELSVYLTKGCIEQMFSSEENARRQLDYYRKYTGLTKVYVECFRGGLTDRALLLRARDFFRAEGLRVATGFMPVWGKYSPTGQMICFSDPEVQRLFAEMLAFVASEFDEIMIDDSLATDCTCPRCTALKGDRSWADFRCELMDDFCDRFILAPARAANKNVHMTIKYPTWHESFQQLGYDTSYQPLVFDETYSGTETRHTSYSLFRNPRYTSYSLIRLLQNTPPNNNRGGWFDSIQCGGSIDNYLEQAELTLMSSPREITLFCWSSMCGSEELAALGVRLEKTDRAMALLGAPAGLPVYIPHRSRGEDHVFDFMGMCGIPADPTPVFPESGLVIITAASACDPELTAKLRAHLARGNDVCLTSGALLALQDSGLDITSMRVTARSQSSAEFGGYDRGWSARNDYYLASHSISMPVIDWMTNDSHFFAMQISESAPNILLAYSNYAGGRAFVLNIPDTYSDMYDIPAPVMGHLRRLLSGGLNVWLEGQSKIALFPRTDCSAALRSFLPHGSVARLHIRGSVPELRTSGRPVKPLYEKNGETVFELALEPNRLAVFNWNK